MANAKVAKKVIDEAGVSILFGADSENPQETLVMALEDFSEEMRTQLALYGLSQKVGDTYSGVKGNVDEAISLAKAAYERLKNGEFKAARESSGSGRVTDLARALAQVAGVELSDAVEKLNEMTKEEKKGLKENVHIAKALNEIAREKLEAKEAELTKEAAEADSGDLANMFS